MDSWSPKSKSHEKAPSFSVPVHGEPGQRTGCQRSAERTPVPMPSRA